MIEPSVHPFENQRLQALRATQLLDSPIDERFERITRMVCRLLHVPVAIFNLIDEDRQHYKSVQGIAATNAAKDKAFCTHAILEEDMLVVPDLREDARFHDNPFVTGERLDAAFYAGCPVRTADGMPIGTLCAIDTKPRELTAEEMDTLRDLAAMLETEVRVASLSKTQNELIGELQAANMLAMVDPMTRLWNRAGMNALLEKEWSEAVRHHKAVSFVMCDIDHFKKINDTYGHPAGDEVITRVAKKLLEGLRFEDVVGRIGGEEFLIVLTGSDAEADRVTVERIRKSIEDEQWILNGTNHPVTMSFGVVSVIPTNDMSREFVIKKADEALYRAKNGGRNRVEAG